MLLVKMARLPLNHEDLLVHWLVIVAFTWHSHCHRRHISCLVRHGRLRLNWSFQGLVEHLLERVRNLQVLRADLVEVVRLIGNAWLRW